MAAAAFAWTGFTKDSVFTSAMDRSIASEFSILRAPRLFSMRAYQPSDCNIEAACMLTGALSALLGREGEASPLRLVNESTRFKPARNGALSAGECERQSYKSEGPCTEKPPRLGLGASKVGTTPSSSERVGSGVPQSRAAP